MTALFLGLKEKLQYAHSLLNRADDLRRSPEAIEQLQGDPACRLVPVFQSKNLFDSQLEPVMAVKGSDHIDVFEHTDLTFLGLQGNIPFFSCLCNEEQAEHWYRLFPDTAFTDLRSSGAVLSGEVASVLAYARGISHWQSINRFCARCGGENQLNSAGHMMKCQLCEAEIFPRTDPAVIMLVEHTDDKGVSRCLLGRSPAWPAGCYSTLAGFVETGESIEAAVIREVFEETGIQVSDPMYVASQPWPFPQSVMLGFTARASNRDLVIDKHELADAGWFSKEEILGFGEWADTSDCLKLPRVDSIARHLINRWVKQA